LQEAPTVLVVGSHPQVLDHVVRSLRNAGYDAVGRIGLEEATEVMEQRDVDAMIVGGPSAHAVRDELVKRLRARHPYARIILPGDPLEAVTAVEEAFGADVN
jgi:DNA-binding NtrC family response regulator